MKVATILGTRPEIIRLSRVIAALDRYTEHVLIHTGQNYDYELNQVFFEDLEIRRPDYFLQAAGKNAAETIGLVISKSERGARRGATGRGADPGRHEQLPGGAGGQTKEDPGLPHGSREPLLRRAGSRGDQPEDRRPHQRHQPAIQRHLPRISAARGDRADRVIKTGSPMYEVLTYYRQKIDRSDVLARLGLTEDGYFVVSAHREENIDSAETVSKSGESPGKL